MVLLFIAMMHITPHHLVLLSTMVMIGTGVVRGGEYHEHGREVERLSPVVMMDEVGIGDEDEVVERGCYVGEMQRKIGTLQELLNRYEEREERLRNDEGEI